MALAHRVHPAWIAAFLGLGVALIGCTPRTPLDGGNVDPGDELDAGAEESEAGADAALVDASGTHGGGLLTDAAVAEDGAVLPDAGNSGLDLENLPCAELPSHWADFLDENQGCSTPTDCTLVGHENWCDCGWYLGDPAGDPLAKSSLDGAAPYLDRYWECVLDGEQEFNACDFGPYQAVDCIDSRCVASNMASCFDAPYDGGTADGGM